MKYSKWIGIAAALLLVAACFLPWTFNPGLDKDFTGFFSEKNMYGKPGWALSVLAAIAIIFYWVPRIWAKRWNLLVCAIILAYAIRTFIIYSTCYLGTCPEKKIGLWLMALASVLMMVMALLPDIPQKDAGQ